MFFTIFNRVNLLIHANCTRHYCRHQSLVRGPPKWTTEVDEVSPSASVIRRLRKVDDSKLNRDRRLEAVPSLCLCFAPSPFDCKGKCCHGQPISLDEWLVSIDATSILPVGQLAKPLLDIVAQINLAWMA